MVSQKYRWDFIGLSTDEKPTSETSDKVVNGSTYYCSDTSKLYVYCDGTWYERKPLGGGGGGGTSDFNDLSNRPKYNGSDMTGSTNIPKVPTATSDLTNDSGFITSSALPTVNDATLTITQNGTSKGTFTANDADDTTIALTDTTYSDFTGTDGTAAGAAGLVPAPATTDAGKFLKADGTWDTAGGGSGPTVVQTTGTSTTDVMSQNATTSMVFDDPATQKRVKIGASVSGSDGSVVIGYNAQGGDRSDSDVVIGAYTFADNGYRNIVIGALARTGSNSSHSIAIGASAEVGSAASGAIAFGPGAHATVSGAVDIGASLLPSLGYNNTVYRLLTGLYNPQSDHDAATKGYVDGIATMGILTTSPTGTTAGVPGRLYTYDAGGGTYDVYLCVHDNGDNTYVWKQVSLI